MRLLSKFIDHWGVQVWILLFISPIFIEKYYPTPYILHIAVFIWMISVGFMIWLYRRAK